jgi:hypothetical protein
MITRTIGIHVPDKRSPTAYEMDLKLVVAGDFGIQLGPEKVSIITSL